MTAARRWFAVFAVLAVTVMTALVATPASASTSARWRAYEYEVTHQGCWYNWGATGPCGSGYDCSGFVYAAYGHVGISLPRTTYAMFSSWKVRRVTHAQARYGDLVAFGTGHVELYAGWHRTIGALESGTRTGYHTWFPSSWWKPTAYYHVVGAG